MGDDAKVSIIASGFDTEIPDDIEALRSKYYGCERRPSKVALPEQPAEPIVEQETDEDIVPQEVKPVVPTWRERISQYISNIFEEDNVVR